MDLAAGVLPEDYLRLRRMARAKLRQYAYHHSIQATDLVHLAWLKMEDHSTPSDKEHFFSYASVVMRNILVDRARKRLRQVEAAEAHPDAMDGVQSADDCNDSQLIQMDEALAKLGEHYPQCSEIVHLRFFVGLSNQEIAKVLSSSERTVKRKLAFAKAFLAKVLLKHSAGATP